MTDSTQATLPAPLNLTAASTVVIIGASIAGYPAALGLRQTGFGGRVTVIDPAEAPYDRPPLSTDFLHGTVDAEGLNLGEPNWAKDNDIDFRQTRVQILDPSPAPTDTEVSTTPRTHKVHLVDGTTLEADAVVLATGARPVMLDVNTGDVPKISLRERADAERLLTALNTDDAHIAVAGSGLLGAEIASSARSLGAEVTLFAPGLGSHVPAFGHRLAEKLFAQHAAHGVRVIDTYLTQDAFDAARHELGETGQDFDAVIAAIGVAPRTKLAAQAGLRISDGVVVDENQATIRPGIFAIGDLARTADAPSRKEHWHQAQASAARVVAALLDQPAPQLDPAWVWSDRYGISAQAVGELPAGTPETDIIHRDTDAVQASFLLDEDNRLKWAATLDDPVSIRAASRLIARQTPIDPAALADPSVTLKELARGHR